MHSRGVGTPWATPTSRVSSACRSNVGKWRVLWHIYTLLGTSGIYSICSSGCVPPPLDSSPGPLLQSFVQASCRTPLQKQTVPQKPNESTPPVPTVTSHSTQCYRSIYLPMYLPPLAPWLWDSRCSKSDYRGDWFHQWLPYKCGRPCLVRMSLFWCWIITGVSTAASLVTPPTTPSLHSQ